MQIGNCWQFFNLPDVKLSRAENFCTVNVFLSLLEVDFFFLIKHLQQKLLQRIIITCIINKLDF